MTPMRTNLRRRESETSSVYLDVFYEATWFAVISNRTAALAVSELHAQFHQLWAIKALRDEPLPLFVAAAEREMKTIAEQQEPDVELRQMTDGHNVIQDYTHTGLTLREHPIAFLRKDLAARSIVTCGEAMSARDGRWLMTAGLVLVRQMPGSAKGVMFLTIEDETGPANVVVWPKLFERRRRVVLGSSMIWRLTAESNGKGRACTSSPSNCSICQATLSALADRDGEFKLPDGPW